MLEIKHVTKRFGGVTALDRCTVTIPRHQITALIGPNGAGKTTLFDVMSGLLKPDAGSIVLDGVEVSHRPAHALAAMGIGRTWQQVRLFKNLSILDHLQMSRSSTDTRLLRSLFLLGNGPQEVYQEQIQKFGIDRPVQTLVSELSYGQRKLLQLAMVFLKPHTLLLLDEPVAGVNKVIQQQIESFLLKLKGTGETIVIVEHDIDFVRRLADYVVVLDAGAVLLQGQPEAVLSDKRVLEAYLGE